MPLFSAQKIRCTKAVLCSANSAFFYVLDLSNVLYYIRLNMSTRKFAVFYAALLVEVISSVTELLIRSTIMSFCGLYSQLLFDLINLLDDEVQVVLAMGGGYLCANSCGAFGNHRIGKSYDVNTLF